ncbi:MAG: alanine--glyoxylate aminotransferase family protein [Anaerolineaceae bacterium]|nr:alanine--glyoxylate aminotransferase family protein [Anaerolineaceae bacterium]
MSVSFIPGTVDVAPEVLAAQARPVIPHHSKEFEELYHSVVERLQNLFNTKNPLFLIPGTATVVQEAGIRNFASARILACVNGAFSSRWSKIAEANGKRIDRLDVSHNEIIHPDLLADALDGRLYDAVTIVHNETASGIVNPVRELAAVVRDISPDTLVLVDAVSSLGGMEIKMDEWGIDYLITVSYNCLALPPGLAFAAVSERALDQAAKVSDRGWFTDFLLWEKSRLQDSTPVIPSVTQIYALDMQLNRILAEGVQNRFARHAEIATRVQTWAQENDMPPFAPADVRSPTVTALQNTRVFDFDDLNQFLIDRGMRIGRGYGTLREKTFRIAHMGEIMMKDAEILLSALDEFFKLSRGSTRL